MTLTDLVKESYDISASKGWHDKPHDPTVRLMLVVTELSEAVEELRKGHSANSFYVVKGKPEGVAAEIADCFIRLADFCAEYGIDIEDAVTKKIAFNRTRPLMHGGRKF